MNDGTTPVEIQTARAGLQVRRHVELFPTGKWSITPAAISLLAHHQVDPAGIIWRHRAGDWGDVDLDQAMANNDAVLVGGPLLSMYRVGRDLVFIETVDSGTLTRIFTSEE